MKSPIKSFALATASLGLAFGTAPAFAADDGTHVPEAQLSYDDLDLSTIDGQRELDRRIDKLAKTMCGANKRVTGTRIRENSRAISECVEAARASAKQQMAAIIEDQRRGG